MACSTGDACGLTDTRSGASRCANHSAVIRLTIEALEVWWPPTFTPERVSRTRLAWCTIAVASHSTRRSTARRTSRSGRASGGDGFVVVCEPLKDCDLPTSNRQQDDERQVTLDAARAPARDPGAARNHAIAVLLDALGHDPARLPYRAPPLDVGPHALAAVIRGLIGPVRPRDHRRVLRVERDDGVDVARVPELDEAACQVNVVREGHEG